MSSRLQPARMPHNSAAHVYSGSLWHRTLFRGPDLALGETECATGAPHACMSARLYVREHVCVCVAHLEEVLKAG